MEIDVASGDRTAIIPLGTKVQHWGRVAAVGNLNRERYYWLVKNGLVTMMPASEPMLAEFEKFAWRTDEAKS